MPRRSPTSIQQILRDSNRIEVFTAACQAMCDMDLTAVARAKITSPALVLGGDEDLMTPWDQGPNGAGQQGDLRGHRGRREARRSGARTTRRSSTRPTSTTAS